MSWPATGDIGPVLAVAGHPPVDEPRIARVQDVVGPEAQPLHHPRPEALDQGVGALAQAQQRLAARRGLEVERHRLAPAAGRIARGHDGGGRGALDPEHVGAQVGEQHAGERRRADPADLEHADVGQWTLADHRSHQRARLPAA